MMRYSITVPLADNDGVPRGDVHDAIRARLAEHFAGFTATNGLGGWFAGVHVGTESVAIYYVDTDDAEARERFRELASYVKTAMNQDAVYLTAQSLEVELV